MKRIGLGIGIGVFAMLFMSGCASTLQQGLREEGFDLIVENSPEETRGRVLEGLSGHGYRIEKLEGCGGESFLTAHKEVKTGDDFGTLTLNWGIFPTKEGKTRVHLTGTQNLQTLDGTVKVFWLIFIPIPYGMSYQTEPLNYGQIDATFLHQILDKLTSPLTIAGQGNKQPPEAQKQPASDRAKVSGLDMKQ